MTEKVNLPATEFLNTSIINPIKNKKICSVLELMVKAGFIFSNKRHWSHITHGLFASVIPYKLQEKYSYMQTLRCFIIN